MKKQKSPIMLVSFLVILVAGAVMFSMSSMKPATPPTRSADQLRSDSREAPSADTVKKALSDATKAVKVAPHSASAPEEGGAPSLEIQKSVERGPAPKPRPNPSSTASQWYGR